MTASPRLHNIALFHDEQPPVEVSLLPGASHVSLNIGPVNLYFDTLADLAELSERITVAVSAAMREHPTRRLRTARNSERIVLQSADEWDSGA